MSTTYLFRITKLALFAAALIVGSQTPLKAADDAFELDASGLTIDEVVASVLARYRTVAQDFSPN